MVDGCKSMVEQLKDFGGVTSGISTHGWRGTILSIGDFKAIRQSRYVMRGNADGQARAIEGQKQPPRPFPQRPRQIVI